MLKSFSRYAPLGVCLSALFLWLSAAPTMRVASAIIIWIIALFALITLVLGIIVAIQYFKLRLALIKKDKALAEAEAESVRLDVEVKRQLLPHMVAQVERGLALPVEFAGVKSINYPVQVIKHHAAALPAPTNDQPLLPVLRDCPNVLVVGGKGSGKTSLLQHLEARLIGVGQCVILDSHALPSQWQGHVIGRGRDYGHIKNAMLGLNDRLDRRHAKRANGQNGFITINTIIDEFTLLPGSLKAIGFNIQKYSIPALTEGRKVDINCLWGIHSDRVEAMGLKGAGDLVECFDAIVRLKHVRGEYYALVDFGAGPENVHYIPPGPYHSPASVPPPTPAAIQFVVSEPEPAELTPNAEESKFIDQFVALRDGPEKFSWRKLCSLCDRSPSGQNMDKIRAALSKWGIDYSEFMPS